MYNPTAQVLHKLRLLQLCSTVFISTFNDAKLLKNNG